MAYMKDGKLYGSVSKFSISPKRKTLAVRSFDKEYSLWLREDGTWIMQEFKVWKHGGGEAFKFNGTYYRVNEADPFSVQETIIDTTKGSSFESNNDDDIPF